MNKASVISYRHEEISLFALWRFLGIQAVVNSLLLLILLASYSPSVMFLFFNQTGNFIHF